MIRCHVKTILTILVLSICLAATPLLAYDDDTIPDDDSTRETNVQVMLGAVRFSALDLQYQSQTDSTVSVNTGITWMPLIGVDGGVELYYNRASFGIEGGGIVSWITDSVNATGGNGTINFRIHNELYLVDLYLGPYVSKNIHDKFRIYGGLGPLLMIGDYDNSSVETPSGSQSVSVNSSSTSFGAGIYGRIGAEYKLKGNSWMGLGVRAYTSKLNFKNVTGTTSLNAIQLFITYSLDL